MPRPDRQAAGAAAEDAALAHLQAAGLRLLGRNLRYKVGELDLVMHDGECTVFVEVRLRNAVAWGDGFDSVDRRKRRKLARAAQCWLLEHPALAERPCRFDVVSLRSEGGAPSLEWERGAFSLMDL
ncbi:MAG TPA: YraN family protein [Arenimonas sp.]|nr:YraN family protein [Arenimonas sp.]